MEFTAALSQADAQSSQKVLADLVHNRLHMYAFAKTLRKANHVRHYSIRNIDSGWQVRAEQDSTSLHEVCYDDWHRVERAHRRIMDELDVLTKSGWVEDTLTS